MSQPTCQQFHDARFCGQPATGYIETSRGRKLLCAHHVRIYAAMKHQIGPIGNLIKPKAKQA